MIEIIRYIAGGLIALFGAYVIILPFLMLITKINRKGGFSLLPLIGLAVAGQRETIAEGPVTSGVGGRPDLLWTRPGGSGVAKPGRSAPVVLNPLLSATGHDPQD